MTLPNSNWLMFSLRQLAPFPSKQWMLLALLIALVSCGGRAASESSGTGVTDGIILLKTTSIQEVQKTADQNSVVTMKGVVGDRVPILDGTVYELQDSTGKIWVVTKKLAPNSGEEVVVTGNVRFKSIPLNGQEQGSVYVEQD